MSTIYRAAGLVRGTAKRQAVHSPLETYWSAFQAWRKRKRMQTQLCHLTDSELADIGITRGEIDYVVSNRAMEPTRFGSS